MKWMFKIVFLLAALWSGYWFFGARAQEKMYVEILTQSRAQGWTAESQNLGVSGFPNRFDTTLTGLNFRDPSGRFSWRGEEFQLKALSYQPNHIIMAWPGEQVLETPAGRVSILADLLRASLVLAPTSSLPLSRFQVEGNHIAVNSAQLGPSIIGQLNGALYQDENADTSYLLGLQLSDITPPNSLTTRLSGGSIFDGAIESIRLSAQVEFDQEIDRLAFSSGQPPRPVRAKIEPSQIAWGGSKLAVSGALSRAGNGYIEGHLDFDIQNWQPLYDVFKQASALTSAELITLKRALDGASGGGNLVFTLSFENGQSRIGPFTIGPAPVYPF